MAHGDYVKAHLLSGSGSGRWQFWDAAVDEFRTSAVHGRGAGSYADWWAAHGALATSIQDAHSLYLETLGELGVVGLALLLLPLTAAALVVATRVRQLDRRTSRSPASRRSSCGYLVAVAIDWMWELTAVSIVAFSGLALVVRASSRTRPFPPLGAATSSRSAP